MGSSAGAILALSVAGVMLVSASPARANADVDAAIAAMDQANLEGAIVLFDRAELNSALTPEELVTLLVHRAIAYQGLDRRDAMLADLQRLAEINPYPAFPVATPPAVRAAFDDTLASIRTPAATRPAQPPIEPPVAPPPPATPTPAGDGSSWGWIAVAAGVAATAVAVGLVLLFGRGGDDDIAIHSPQVDMPEPP